MYAAITDESLRQGDVVTGCLFVEYEAPKVDCILPSKAVERRELGPELRVPEDALVLATPMVRHGMVISQCCDAAYRPYMLLVPVFPIEEIVPNYAATTNPRKRAKIVSDVHGPKHPDLFYLRDSAETGFPKSVACLHQVQAVAAEGRAALVRARLLRLTAAAREDLQFQLSFFFGRHAYPDDYFLTDEEVAALRVG